MQQQLPNTSALVSLRAFCFCQQQPLSQAIWRLQDSTGVAPCTMGLCFLRWSEVAVTVLHHDLLQFPLLQDVDIIYPLLVVSVTH